MNAKDTRVAHYYNLAVDAMFVSQPGVRIRVLVLLHGGDHADGGGEGGREMASPEAAWAAGI
jgi:hypothetical protein